MAGEDSAVLGNLVLYALVCLVPAALLWISNRGPFATRIAHAATGIIDRPRAEESTSETITDVAARVRRIRRDLDRLAPTTPVVRRSGILLAYDEALDTAATMLQVPVESPLSALPLGSRRDVARMILESQLSDAGLRFD